MEFAGWLCARGRPSGVLWPGIDDAGPASVRVIGQEQYHIAVARDSVQDAHLGCVGDVAICVVGTPRWRDAELEARRHAGELLVSIGEAWKRWGAALLERLEGAFSLVVIDGAHHRALLASDRFAIHPVVWAVKGSGADATLVFASHVGPVRRHPALGDPPLDPQAVYDYLHFHVVPAPKSIYRGIDKLRAGERLLWQDGDVELARYWEPTFAAPGHRADMAGLQQAVQDALAQSVSRTTEQHADIACFLSGGLDSSSVSGLFARARGERTAPAYTMGFEADGFDEMAYARIAARHFRIDLHERYIEPDEVAEAMPLVAAWYDEPFGNSSAVPAFVCAGTAAQDGITHLLAGDGGDELFAGNSRYVRQQLFSYYDRLPGAAQSLLQHLLGLDADGPSPLRAIPGVSKLVSYVDQARPGMPARYDSYNYLVRYGAEKVLTPELLALVDTAHPLALMEEVWKRAPTENLLQRMLYLDWQFTLADNDLRKVGEMCAAVGVAVSYPMLDDDVLALSLQVPPNELIRGHRLRHFFKEAMTGFLPTEIIHKKKHGFGLPFGDWLNRSATLRELVFPALQRARDRGFVNAAFIEEMTAAHRDGNANYYGGMLWVVVMLELWLSSHGHG
jgi:asparagine synthase (glutamine-hydrolysing)